MDSERSTKSTWTDSWFIGACIALPGLVAAAAAYAAGYSHSLYFLAVVPVALLVLARQPLAVTVVALLLCQEIAPDDPRHTDFTTTLGSQLYFGLGGSSSPPTIIPAFVLLVAAAAARAIQLLRARRAGARILDPFGTAVIAIVIALAVWAVALGLDATGFLFGATNQEARPFLLVAFGFVVGLGLPGEGRTTKITTICSGAALIVLAALSAIALVGGAASIALNAYYTPFYDSALPAAAGAVALALLFYRGHSAWWTRVIVFIAAVEIVVISLRRNVWLAAAAVLLLGLVAAHGRGQAARRIVGAVLILVPLLISLPAATAALASRLYDTLYALSDDTDVSTQGHIRDIEIGWQYATGSPISGLGSRHPQLPGVVDQNNGLIYLHNEWLLDWLRFGVPGLVLMVALMLLLVFGSVSVLRARSNLSLPHLTAAMFLLLLPISCVTAPFLSTTNRWPALIGIAAGVLTSARIAVQHTPPRASEPDQGADVRAEFPRVDAQRIPSS